MIGALAALATLPAVAAHEATHALLAAPVAELRLRRVGRWQPAVGAVYRRDTPGWWQAVAAVGPTLVGAVVGVLAVLWLAVGDAPAVAASARRLVLAGVCAVWWGVYTMPSGGDLRAAYRAVNNQSDTHGS
jgi:hypothetical protein